MNFWNWPNEGSLGEKMCHMGVLRGIFAKINEMARSGWKEMGLSESKKVGVKNRRHNCHS